MFDWLKWIPIFVGGVSLVYNLWQYHRYSKRREALGSSMADWWHFAISMRESIEVYWKGLSKNPSQEEARGNAKGVIDGLYAQSARLADAIERAAVAEGFRAPGDKFWGKRENYQSSNN